MKQRQKSWWLIGLVIFLFACSAEQPGSETVASSNTVAEAATIIDQITQPATDTMEPVTPTEAVVQPVSTGAQQTLPSEAMRTAHMSPIPDVYSGLVSPISAETESLERGAEVYTSFCAVCHGDGGMGDGPANVTLNPPAAPVAQSSRMMSDAYFFWRVSEGGQGDPVTSAMPAWKASLDEQQIWDVINYMRSLGSGAEPRRVMGGMQFNPAAEQVKQEAMLTTAVEMKLITPEDVALFQKVHDLLDAQMGQGNGVGQTNGRGNPNAPGRNGTAPGGGNGFGRGQGGPGLGQMQAERMAGIGRLVADGLITQEEALAFEQLHTLLTQAGLLD